MNFSLNSDELGPHACVAHALREEPTPQSSSPKRPHSFVHKKYREKSGIGKLLFISYTIIIIFHL